MTEIVDDQGEVIERCRYSPYGKLKIYDSSWNELTASALGNPYFFTGREYDPESGLYYYRARMYSQILGRFLQPDPIGYLGDLNLYRYCSNNPINLSDPFGKESGNVDKIYLVYDIEVPSWHPAFNEVQNAKRSADEWKLKIYRFIIPSYEPSENGFFLSITDGKPSANYECAW